MQPIIFEHSAQNLPITLWVGSKRRLVKWIWEKIRNLDFNSVLDAFGGGGSVGLFLKYQNKQVFFNDIQKSAQVFGYALIENNTVRINPHDSILFHRPEVPYLMFEKYYKVFQTIFKRSELGFILSMLNNIHREKNKYRKYLLLSALLYFCLYLLPFADFTRSSLNYRMKKRPIPLQINCNRKYYDFIMRFNAAIYNNQKNNKVVGGYDILELPKIDFDLIYLDPPYSIQSFDYADYFRNHYFLDFLADFLNWRNLKFTNLVEFKKIAYEKNFEILKKFQFLSDKENYKQYLISIFEKYRDKIIVLSYREDCEPKPETLKKFLLYFKKQVRIFQKAFRSNLSKLWRKEVLIVGI